MEKAAIIVAESVFIFIFLIFVIAYYKNVMKRHRNTESKFTVSVPKFVFSIGVTEVAVFWGLMFLFTIFSYSLPNVIFYILCTGLLCIGLYLCIKTSRWKVDVKNDAIFVSPIVGKSYETSFQEIKSANRQLKNNEQKPERIVILFTNNKRIVVENIEHGYELFCESILSHVAKQKLTGFDISTNCSQGEI